MPQENVLQCPQRTGGTCSWFGYCWKYRGPTRCVSGECLCQPGSGKDSCHLQCFPCAVSKIKRKAALKGPLFCTEAIALMTMVNVTRGCQIFTLTLSPSTTTRKAFHHARIACDTIKLKPFAEEQLETAVALSGGGTRAQVAAIGALRGMEELQLMSRVDLLVSVSGGTWTAGPYMFPRTGRSSYSSSCNLNILN